MIRVAALVAAAGLGRRYGGHKLHAKLDGRPVLAWTLDALHALPLAARIVVVAPDDADAAALARAAQATVVVNPTPARGLGSSLACGVRALAGDVADGLDGVLVLLGDMPRVKTTSIEALLECHTGLDARAIVAPVHAGRRGHPVLFGAAHFPALAALQGDEGARALLREHPVTTVEVEDVGVLLDIDTPADLAAARCDDEA